MRTVTNPTQSQTSPAALVIYTVSIQVASRRLASHTRGRRVVSSPLSLRRLPTRLCSLLSFSGAAPCASVLPICIYISTVAKSVHSGVVTTPECTDFRRTSCDSTIVFKTLTNKALTDSGCFPSRAFPSCAFPSRAFYRAAFPSREAGAHSMRSCKCLLVLRGTVCRAVIGVGAKQRHEHRTDAAEQHSRSMSSRFTAARDPLVCVNTSAMLSPPPHFSVGLRS